MIGVDTNVLVRLFVADDLGQHERAVRFFEARSAVDPAFVSIVTAVEFVWVLKRAYRRPHKEALGLLEKVVSSEDALIESVDSVVRALELASESDLDFADILIADAGELAGCEGTATFDKHAAKHVPGMELLK